MAKDLPYFKFVVSDWMVGDITGCSLSAQGLFINLCAFYWSKGGDLTLEKLNRKYPRHKKQITELLDEGILKISSGKVEVKFLDEQLEERGHVSSKNSENAKSRWNGGKPDATALRTHESGNAKSCNIESEERREESEKKREEKKPLRAGGKKIVIDNLFPLGTPEHNAWEEWRQYRKEIKKTLSPSTAKKQMQFLGGRAGPEIVEIINQSIKHGWTGLFPLKTEQNGNHVKGTNGTTSAQIAGTRYTGSKL